MKWHKYPRDGAPLLNERVLVKLIDGSFHTDSRVLFGEADQTEEGWDEWCDDVVAWQSIDTSELKLDCSACFGQGWVLTGYGNEAMKPMRSQCHVCNGTGDEP